MRVGVGEGWWSYFYLDSMKTAVIFPSVCETFLHSPSPGDDSSGDQSNKSCHCGVFLLYLWHNKNIKTPPQHLMLSLIQPSCGVGAENLISSSALAESITALPVGSVAASASIFTWNTGWIWSWSHITEITVSVHHKNTKLIRKCFCLPAHYKQFRQTSCGHESTWASILTTCQKRNDLRHNFDSGAKDSNDLSAFVLWFQFRFFKFILVRMSVFYYSKVIWVNVCWSFTIITFNQWFIYSKLTLFDD